MIIYQEFRAHFYKNFFRLIIYPFTTGVLKTSLDYGVRDGTLLHQYKKTSGP